jgi:hypothetical protein
MLLWVSDALLAQQVFELDQVDLVIAQHFGHGLAQQGQQLEPWAQHT